MTNKLSYMYKVCTGIEKSVFVTLLIFYLFIAKWTAVHNLVLFTLTLSHIIATRDGLDLSSMTCVFKKFVDWNNREPAQSVCVADCYFIVNVLD